MLNDIHWNREAHPWVTLISASAIFRYDNTYDSPELLVPDRRAGEASLERITQPRVGLELEPFHLRAPHDKARGPHSALLVTLGVTVRPVAMVPYPPPWIGERGGADAVGEGAMQLKDGDVSRVIWLLGLPAAPGHSRRYGLVRYRKLEFNIDWLGRPRALAFAHHVRAGEHAPVNIQNPCADGRGLK
jgi:hypothetical protein